MATTSRNLIASIVPLGFTELEAAAYAFLLRDSPATGYRVAQGIGKPVANTYKALSCLQAKGAVSLEETESREFRAVPAAEVLARTEKRFAAQRRAAELALAQVQPRVAARDEQIYRLTSANQVFERCRSLLRAARRLVLIEAFPEVVAPLADDIAACAKRKVRVLMQVYEPTTIRGVETVLNYRAGVVRKRWHGQWLNVAGSGEYVLALLSADGEEVQHATWSASTFLSRVYASGLLGEIFTSAMHAAVQSGAPAKELERIARRQRKIADSLRAA